MMNQDCKAYRAELEESPGGPAQSPGLRSHLSTCTDCEHFRRERASLRQLVGGLERVTAPADFEFRLRARLAAAEAARRHNPFFSLRFVPGVASVALAACFLVFSASIYLRRETATSQPDKQESAETVASQSASVQGRAPERTTIVKNIPDEKGIEQHIELAAKTAPQGTKARNVSNARASFAGKAHGGVDRGAGHVATFDAQPAPILNASSSAVREQGSSRTDAAAVALRTPTVPLQVVLRDEHGAARLVSMRSVSFGAQDPVRQGGNVVPVSYKDKEGVW